MEAVEIKPIKITDYQVKQSKYEIDYSRLNCILWGVCKNQKKLITSLDERLKILEAKI